EVGAFTNSRWREAGREGVEVGGDRLGRSAAEKSAPRHRRLLRARRERPSRRAADERDEAAALHVAHRPSSGPSSLPPRREPKSQYIPMSQSIPRSAWRRAAAKPLGIKPWGIKSLGIKPLGIKPWGRPQLLSIEPRHRRARKASSSPFNRKSRAWIWLSSS